MKRLHTAKLVWLVRTTTDFFSRVCVLFPGSSPHCSATISNALSVDEGIFRDQKHMFVGVVMAVRVVLFYLCRVCYFALKI